MRLSDYYSNIHKHVLTIHSRHHEKIAIIRTYVNPYCYIIYVYHNFNSYSIISFPQKLRLSWHIMQDISFQNTFKIGQWNRAVYSIWHNKIYNCFASFLSLLLFINVLQSFQLYKIIIVCLYITFTHNAQALHYGNNRVKTNRSTLNLT